MFIAISLLLLLSVSNITEVKAVTELEILQNLTQIGPLLRPVRDSSQPVQLNISMTVVRLVDVDEIQQLLTLDVWFIMQWVNEFVEWNPTDGPPGIVVPSRRVWIPDLYVQNSLGGTTDHLAEVLPQGGLVSIEPDGSAACSPSLHLVVSCEVDTTYFPFDSQECVIHTGSWTHNEKLLNISLSDGAISLGADFIEGKSISHSQWEITSAKANRIVNPYVNVAGSFTDVFFTIRLKRRPMYHVIHIILPCILLHALSLATFQVPPEGGERVSVGVTAFLSYSVFSLVVTEQSPESSKSMPLVSIYLTLTLVLNLLTVLWSVHMVRSWLRPPANCEDRPAVRLPKRLLVLIQRKYHSLGRVCQCGDQLKTNHRKVDVKNDDVLESTTTRILCDRELVPSYHESAETNKDINQTSQRTDDLEYVTKQTLPRLADKPNQRADVKCQWHSSLDATDKLLFLASLSFWFVCVISSLVVVPARHGYFV